MNRFHLPAAALAAAVAIAACGRPAAGPPAAPPPPEVTVVTVVPKPLELPFEAPGRLQGSREVEVRARVRGILEAWLYREGEPVRAGQPMFRIDPAPYRAAVERAKGAVGEAEARLARATRDVARLEPLAAQEAVSRRELDDALSERDEAAAALDSARAALTSAELELGWTTVTAPVAGVSGRALASQGTLVDDGERSLLTTISRIDPMWALFTLSARDFERLQAELARGGGALDGLEVELALADGRVHPRRGRLNFAGSQVDPATGSIELRAELDNADGALLPGGFVRVALRGVVRPAAVTVPQRAIQQGPEGAFVLVVDAEGKAERRPVSVSLLAGGDWVVDSGLDAGDRVIVDGALKVAPGAEVRVVEPAAEGAEAGG